MGTTKLMGERLITAANSTSHGEAPIFASTRFGNVLGSNGSVVPIFRKQIAKGGPVTLTDPGMTRFIMSIDEAVKLILDSVSLSKGGDVLITKMPVIRIKDLAEVMIDSLAQEYGYQPDAIKIINIGSKPGEKLYEELMSSEETRRAIELENFFSVLPAFRGIYKNITYDYPDIKNDKVSNPYDSSREEPLTKEEIHTFLEKNNLLHSENQDEYQPDKQYWPGEEN
jgi:FlaA1/EpsC-like NDP-sugar epimerase